MPASLAFVAAPAASPVVKLSLTDPVNQSVMVADFTLGAPTFEAAPYSVGAEYGERTVAFTVQIIGTYSQAASAMQAVARQLLTDRNWLMLDFDTAAQPVFLRTYRTQQDAIAWENSGVGIWELPVTLVCDPFLYGAPVTVGPVTITNNPTSGANPMWYKFASVLGDAPTGVKVNVVPSVSWQDYSPLMATAAYTSDETPTGPQFWQTTAAGFTAGGNVTTPANNAIWSGSNSLLFTPTGTANATRVSGAASPALVPGTYKVLVRVGRSDTTSTFRLRFGQITGLASDKMGEFVDMAQGTSIASPYITWVDLGEFTFPIGAGGVDYADIGTLAQSDIRLQVSRLAGTGNLNLDVFLLIPVDTATTVDTSIVRTRFVGIGPSTTTSGVWDGARTPSQFRAYAGASLATLTPPRIDGRYLRLTPGLTNVFYLVQQTEIDATTSTVNNSDVLAATASVTFSYLPKYLHARPDTT